MVWHPHLDKMQDTWIRKENIEQRLFRHCFFNDPFEVMIEKLKS
jgi:hypothetical protein